MESSGLSRFASALSEFSRLIPAWLSARGVWRLFLASGLAAVLGSSHLVAAGTLTLEIASRDAEVTRLLSQGAQGTNVNLQGSFDLETWFVITSAPVENGQAVLTHTNNEPVDAWFYRAADEPALRPLNVGPQLDTNRTTSGIITPETGGELELIDAAGILYHFSVATNSVVEPLVVTMTAVTNFTALPMDNRFRAAVSFEPSGAEFRNAGTLTIRFPQTIPSLEMVAYGFETSGEQLHLRPWETATNEVSIPIFHFSGAGVAAQAFTAAGDAALHFEQVRTSMRDGERAADQRAGESIREISRERQAGRMTAEDFELQLEAIRLLRNAEVYSRTIKPLLGAAARDCEIGEAVLNKLDQLEANSGRPYGDSRFFRMIKDLAPAVRCECARKILQRCENDPNSSGVSATAAMSRILLGIEAMTGRTDGAGCDLGSDDQIFERLARAACHKPWEGTVRYSRVETENWETFDGNASSSTHQRSRLRDEMSYIGQITGVRTQDGGRASGVDWQSWKLSMTGDFAGSVRKSSLYELSLPEWTVKDLTFEGGGANPSAPGTVDIRIENGQFVSVVPSAGLDGVKYPVVLRQSTERQVTCREPECPQPIPLKTVVSGTQDMHFATGLDRSNPSVQIVPGLNGMTFIFNRIRIEPIPLLHGTNIVEEHVRVQLWKGTR